MRRLVLVIVVGLVVVSCGDGDSNADPSSDVDVVETADVPDPCTLVDQSILDSYFNEAVEPEPGEVGPLDTCKWKDSNANSLLVQVSAVGGGVTRPDPCDGCVDLAFADEGYASGSSFQSIAVFDVGSTHFSVATTGLGDDSESIAALAELVYEASK